MLPARHRLKERRDIQSLFQKGKSLKGEMLLMKYQEEAGPTVQIGFSVSLKFSKKATKRNKAKRWMREAARARLGRIKCGSRILFILDPKASLEKLSLQKISDSMEKLLKKGKLFS